MTARNKGLWMLGVTFVLTLLVMVFKEIGPVKVKAMLLVIWAFFGWNYFAYAFDRDMWPWVFIELDGGGKGVPMARGFMLWLTALINLSFLALNVFYAPWAKFIA